MPPEEEPPQKPHPDFDGHLERPFETWTAEERLRWLDDMLALQWEAKQGKR